MKEDVITILIIIQLVINAVVIYFIRRIPHGPQGPMGWQGEKGEKGDKGEDCR